MNLEAQRCTACQHVHFPTRLGCPECGGTDLVSHMIEKGVVESSTRTMEGTTLLAVDCAGGPRVVARLLGAASTVAAGTEIVLTTDAAHRGPAAFVPSPDSPPQPGRLADDIDLADCTLPGLLAARAALTPNAPLFRCGDLTRSAVEMVAAVSAAGGALQERGVMPGDRVAIISGNRAELLDLVLGAAWIGAVAVPINVAARGAQLRHILTNSGATLLVLEDEFVEHVDALEPIETLAVRWVLTAETASMGEPVPAATMQPGEPAVILYTSGTTGVSKGVVCPHGQFYWWGRNVSEQLGITAEDVLYTCLPLFHTNALNAFSQALVSGASYVLGERFSASRFWSRMADSGATFTYLLGAMVGILDAQPASELDRQHRVRAALSPGTPGRLLESFHKRFGVALLDGYGSTETNSVIATRPDDVRPGYIGRLQPGFSMRVVDVLGADVPAGTPGELLLRSDQPHAFASGYYAMPEATVEAWGDLWFHTGDRVVVDPDGWIRFVDRIKDVIRRRGENISSVEVEDVLAHHDAIEHVAVFAVDSELGEEEVMAAIVPRPGHSLDFSAIVDYCRPRLASYAIPRFFVERADLPLTENGKVRKRDLRSLGTDGAWDREPPRTPRADVSHIEQEGRKADA